MGIVTSTLVEDSLTEMQQQQQDQFDSSFDAPSYMRAANLHSSANQNKALTEGDSFLEDIPAFIAASVVSGATQLYNILPSVGNMLGGNYEVSDIGEVMQSLDEDLGLYYQEHDTAVDTVGFILSSLVPGMAGIKGLRAVQSAGIVRLESAMATGKIGETTGKALGLLAPSRERHLAAAIKELTTTNTPFKLTNANVLRSIGSGIGQNVLEAAAFEVAVAASMHNSPIMEGMDAADLVNNILLGGVVFGAVGGLIDATRGVFKVRGAVTGADKEGMPWTHFRDGAGLPTDQKFALYWDEAHSIPAVPAGVDEARAAFLTNAGQKKKERLLQLARKEIAELASGDQETAAQMYTILNLGPPGSALENVTGLKSIDRIAGKNKIAAQVDKTLAKMRKDPKKVPLSEVEAIENLEVGYVKVHGSDAGNFVSQKPAQVTLADTMKTGDKIVVDAERSAGSVSIQNAAGKITAQHKFSLNDNYSVLTSGIKEANARHIWAKELKPFSKLLAKKVKGKTVLDDVIVNESDIPLLEKMYREFDPAYRVRLDADSTLRSFSDADDLLEFIRVTKEKNANRLLEAGTKGTVVKNAQEVEDRLRAITGIDFVVKELPENVLGRRESRFLGRSESAIKAGRFRQIAMNEQLLTKVPIHRLVQTLKHEEGHTIFDSILENTQFRELAISGIPASKYADVHKELIRASRKIRAKKWQAADAGDSQAQAYLNLDQELMADTFAYFSLNADRAAKELPNFNALFGDLARPIPEKVIASFAARAKQLTQEEIASMLNVRNSYLSGMSSKVKTRDLFAMESYAEEYTETLVTAGLRKQEAGLMQTWKQPNYVRTVYDHTPVKDIDGNTLRGLAAIKENQRIYQQTIDVAVADVLGPDAAKFGAIAEKDILGANQLGAEAGFVSTNSANYGSLAATVNYIGQATSGVVKKFQDRSRELLEPALYKLAQSEKATIEWATLNANLRAIPDQYVLNETGDALIPRVLADALDSGGDLSKVELRAADAPEIIHLLNPEVRELAALHIGTNGKRVRGAQTIHTAQGTQNTWSDKVFYPTPVNTRDFPHFALVQDASITGVGAKKMIYANTPEQLDEMIRKLDNEPNLVVRTKAELEKHFKSIDEFDYESTMHENWIDSALYRNGVSSPYYVPTDAGKITSELLSWHMGAEASLVRGAVKAKYEKAFNELHALGEGHTNLGTSQVGNASLTKNATAMVRNPYAGYERVALGLKDYTNYPLWTSMNRQADTAISRMYDRIAGVVESSKTPAELDHINAILKQSGYKGAAYDEEMLFLANHTAPKGALSSFVAKGNALLASVVLRLDSLNAVNNAVGATVLRTAEIQSVIRQIKAGNADAVGELTQLAHIKVPGTDDFILSPAKMVAKALHNFHDDKYLKTFYRENGFMTSISDQYRQTLDHLTLAGKESVKELEGKIATVQNSLRKAADTGEKWTGNRLAEEFNRFISADIMKQMSDILVKRGKMTPQTQLAYINTFVNRVEGNYLAAQRPMAFQGPIGQAIGLFQTYQFNLMQQLLRHVGEGTARDSMTLLGMQGTIYGMNGLPGFNAINTHIIGSASGNQQHKDLYDVTYGIAGKEAGDWLSYGVASNMLLHPDLKVNLYVRGDINPRHLTLLPTDPASVPIVQATGKFLANIKRTAQKLGQGGDPWTIILQGLEHNGVSRPLAGLAQTLEAAASGNNKSYSTSKKGNVIASNDFFSLANMGRIVGGKPLDEAIALDAAFRFKTYALKDSKNREILGAAIKSTLIAGNQPTLDQVEQFTQRYTELGGSQSEYNKWVMQLYKTANTSQANKLSQDLNSPFNTSMQKIMGGYELADFAPPQ